ncbi:hypothetical protein D3C81_1144710 [compost metagenome]
MLFAHVVHGKRCDHVHAPVFKSADHLGDAVGTLHFEAQPCTQADQVEQVGGNPAEMPIAVEIGQRCGRLVDSHLHHRMAAQPLLLFGRELQLPVAQQ